MLLGRFATHRTLAKIIFDHGIVACTGASKFITRKNVADIDKQKGNTKDQKYDDEHLYIFHRPRLIKLKKSLCLK